MNFLISISQLPQACNHPSILETIKTIYFILKVITTTTPILIITVLMINLVKAVTGNTEMSVVTKNIFDKLLAGVIIYLIPTVVMCFLNIVGERITFKTCVDLAMESDISELKAEYENLKETQKKDKIYAAEHAFDNKSTGNETDMLNLIKLFEGTTASCTINGEPGYLAENIGDKAITVGPGITGAVKKGMVVGECYPKSEIDALYTQIVKSKYYAPVDNTLKKYNIEWPEYKKHALTSLSYQSGPGVAKKAIKKYAENGEKAMEKYIKEIIYATVQSTGVSSIWCGLPKRRDAELKLYYTGTYPTKTSNKLVYYKKNDAISKKIKDSNVPHYGKDKTCSTISFTN